MFSVQKGRSGVQLDSDHGWVNASLNGFDSNKGLSAALAQFYTLTKLKRTPWRLKLNAKVVAAVNTNGASDLKRYAIKGVKLGEEKGRINRSTGCVVNGSLVGSGFASSASVEAAVGEIAQAMSSLVLSHSVTVRFNHGGLKGGAWLCTDPVDDIILSNSDVGISFGEHNRYRLYLGPGYCRPEYVNKCCCWTQEGVFEGEFGTLDKVLVFFKKAVVTLSDVDYQRYFISEV
ncbi:hypothetical protein [Photobacterium leiognathi]|uniref:hypothetical protein n=1 Tax=Photobacterium leiognathi TaxID=553611 RepID=UPI002981FA9A|nr:hypothetical protein [Photobacterium leiognathi]